MVGQSDKRTHHSLDVDFICLRVLFDFVRVLVFYVSIHVRGRTTKHFELLAGAVCGGG
jgi:hypothetical protein